MTARSLRVVLLLCAVVAAGSCAAAEPPADPGAPDERRGATPTDVRAQDRRATAGGLRVTNEARGPSRRRVTIAVRDLKQVSLWRPLTRDLYSLQLQTDPGTYGVPDDGHLADAMIGAVVEPHGSGTHCSIRFYPAAIRAELDTLEEGYRTGTFGAPPSYRQLWAAVLAHELAHCRDWEGAEPYAKQWEARALEAVRGAGLE